MKQQNKRIKREKETEKREEEMEEKCKNKVFENPKDRK